VTLDHPEMARHLTFVREPRKIPVILSLEEIARLLEAAPGPKYKAALSAAYAGLRVPATDQATYPCPYCRRSHEHHRDLQLRLDTAIQTAAANRDQDRYVMITLPTSQIQNPVLPRRPSIRHGGARANMPLPRQRRHRSSWLTADSRTRDGPIMRRNVVSQHTHRRRLPSRTSVVRKPP